MRKLFFQVKPWQAILETLLMGGLLWGILLLAYWQLPPAPRQEIVSILIGPLCMIWCAMRLRLPDGPWWRRRLVEAIVYGFAGGVLACVLIWLQGSAFTSNTGRAFVLAGLALFALIMNAMVFILGRIGSRLLMFWDQLRRTQLLWSLTHAHLMVVGLATALFIVVLDLTLLISNRSHGLLLLPATLGLATLGIIAMVVVLPPSALFSFLVVRNTTRRLKALTEATGALRSGNYSVRVPVVGEDEVAQLQADFNAMAANLERAMRELQEERDTVARLLQSRRELIANVSHELRTPVATLRGYLETTLMHWDDNPQKMVHHNLRVMEDEVIHLQTLVEDLFTLARTEVGNLALQCCPTDVGQLARRIVETSAPLIWQKSRIDLVADVPPDLPQVVVDPHRLEQALQNLLHNGVRHTAPGGIIAVTFTVNNDEVVIHVKDTGEGIAPEDLAHIWERFYQTARTRSRQDGGAGLGLALVKEWIEAMGGRVAVESTLGEGTCFSLYLPRIKSAKRDDQQDSQYPATKRAALSS